MALRVILLASLVSCITAPDGSVHLLSDICLSGDGCSLCLEEK